MKKNKSTGLRPEYHREDLGAGIRGKYLDNYKKGTNLVLLNPDVAKAFPTEESVNKALKSLIDKAKISEHYRHVRVLAKSKKPKKILKISIVK